MKNAIVSISHPSAILLLALASEPTSNMQDALGDEALNDIGEALNYTVNTAAHIERNSSQSQMRQVHIPYPIAVLLLNMASGAKRFQLSLLDSLTPGQCNQLAIATGQAIWGKAFAAPQLSAIDRNGSRLATNQQEYDGFAPQLASK